ncbi:hypothetical protein D3C78_1558880 [compost metagenome]
MGRHPQLALATDLHAHQAQIPALDDATGADHALEGFAATVGRIEFGAVFEGAAVLGGDQRTFDYAFAVALFQVDDLQLFIHGGIPRVIQARGFRRNPGAWQTLYAMRQGTATASSVHMGIVPAFQIRIF